MSEVITVLLLAILLGNLSTCSCCPSPKITVQSDPRVFALFAGLAAVGYGEGQVDPASQALRTELKDCLSQLTADDLYPMTSLEQDYPTGQLVSATLRLGPPPDLAVVNEGAPPGLQAFLGKVWTLIEPLYESSRQVDTQALEAMAEPAAAVIKGAVDYTRGKAPCRTWKVVAEPLALPGHPSSCRDGATAWIVLSPASDTWQSDLAREAYGLLVHDELARLQGQGALDRFQPVLEIVGSDADLPTYIGENLAWALTARALSVSDMENALAEATQEGFALARGFCDKLADYEASGQPLRSYLNELLVSVDLDSVLASTPPNWTKWYWDWPGLPTLQGWILRAKGSPGTIVFSPIVAGCTVNALSDGTDVAARIGRVPSDREGEWTVYWSQGWTAVEEAGPPGKLTLSGTGVVWAFPLLGHIAPDPPSWQFVPAAEGGN